MLSDSGFQRDDVRNRSATTLKINKMELDLQKSKDFDEMIIQQPDRMN